MNYLREILGFYDFLQSNQLSTGQIALWHALMYINNKCRFAEWFTAPNLRLELLTGLSRQAITKNRNALKQIGLIDFKSNGTKAASYKILPMSNSLQDSLQNESTTSNSLQDSCQSVYKIVAEEFTRELPNGSTLNKQKQNKNKTERSSRCARVYEAYEQNIGLLSSVVAEAINGYLEDGVEAEMLCLAIEEAAVNNGRTWSYINAILADKVKRGIKTASAYQSDRAEWERRKQDKAKAATTADNGKWATGNDPSVAEIIANM